MKKLLLAIILLSLPAFGQITPYGYQLIQKPNALSARDWLGVAAFTNGIGITFTILPSGVIRISNSGAGSGTVTSVGLSMPGIFSVSGSPVTTSGTLTATLANESANTVFSGPSSGGASTPSFRLLVVDDIPSLILTKISDAGTAAYSNATAFVLSPTNSGSDGQVVSKTGSQTKWITSSGSGSDGIDITLQSINPTDSGTNFDVDFQYPAQLFNATGSIAFNFSQNVGSGSTTSRVANIFVQATNYARKIFFLNESTNWNLSRQPYILPAKISAQFRFQDYGGIGTNISMSYFPNEFSNTNMAGAFDPTSVTGLKLWIEASRGVWQDYNLTIPAQDEQEVRGLTDWSGTGNHLTNNAAATMTTIYLSGKTAPFGVPCIAIRTGSAGTSALNSPSFAALTQPNWVFIVYWSLRGGNPVFDSQATGARISCFPANWGGTLQLFAGSSLTATAPVNPYWTLFSFKFNGASSIIRTNAAQAVTGAGGAGAPAGFRMGTDAAGNAITFASYIAEILVYNANLSNGDRDSIEEYLRAKYALY